MAKNLSILNMTQRLCNNMWSRLSTTPQVRYGSTHEPDRRHKRADAGTNKWRGNLDTSPIGELDGETFDPFTSDVKAWKGRKRQHKQFNKKSRQLTFVAEKYVQSDQI